MTSVWTSGEHMHPQWRQRQQQQQQWALRNVHLAQEPESCVGPTQPTTQPTQAKGDTALAYPPPPAAAGSHYRFAALGLGMILALLSAIPIYKVCRLYECAHPGPPNSTAATATT